MKSVDKKIWYKYIRTYESFKKEIPDELKEIFKDVRNIIGIPTDSFNIDIDLNKLNFCDLIIELEVDFEKLDSGISYEDKDIIYYSNININDLVLGKKRTKVPIIIKDLFLNVDKLCSVISHEIRHIYDVYTINEESDMKSFIKSIYYAELYESEDNHDFLNFLNLIYLSLEHELIARNTMIWEMFSYCKCSKDELYKLYHQSYMYKSFNILKSFNYNLLIKDINIIQKVNNFINYFGGTLCNNENDVIIFFDNWKKYFNEKSEEYLTEGYKILEDILSVNEFNNNKVNIKKIKDMLLHIHNHFILIK
jgi:hypothetical protein